MNQNGKALNAGRKFLPERSKFTPFFGAVIGDASKHELILGRNKFIIIFALFGFLLTGCNPSDNDAAIQKKLVGTWTHNFSNGCSVTNVIAVDGSYYCQLVAGPNGPTDIMEGALIARKGILIDTVTKDSQTNQQTPRVTQYQILHLDGKQLVLSINKKTTNVVMDKVQK